MEVCSLVNDKIENCISSLEGTFSESLHIRDAEKSEYASEGHEICNVAEEILCEVIKPNKAKLNTVCLKKSATFPIPCEEEAASVTESSSEHFAHQTYSRSISLPAPSELKSAMKGSRDKNGEGHVKLTVKWAADVYDPIPSLVSHTVKNKKQPKSRKKKNEKKNMKKGNKGNSARGGNGKDKKQSRNVGEQSDQCYQSSDSQVIDGSSDFDTHDVCSQDSNCGASFLKKSVTEMHYSVAEAQ
ncbi:uncharacterized protein LOC131610077 [Vicia villosa]|uniref:uncharacterized protein LOC131610077 n=1 Tax=Vicia villosa TaxID=3911 RepID=UPI00273AE42E|nr:uncharacterized protein LOC131610077 [Vicia villosa]XP_058737929.1 uncharacterized protein LOC131610077 [Vicia villosa]